MKIILSTDFSEENKVLLPYAIDFLKNSGGEIIVFHAYMDNVFVGSNCYPGNMDTDNYFTTELALNGIFYYFPHNAYLKILLQDLMLIKYTVVQIQIHANIFL